MDNLRFIDEEDIPLIHQDEDYDDYNTSNTSRIDETSFTVPDATEATSTLQLRQNVKRDKITALYRRLNVTGNLDRFNRSRSIYDQKKKKKKKNQKQAILTCFLSMVITIGNPLLINVPVGFYQQKH